MCLKRSFDEKVFQTLLFFDHFRTCLIFKWLSDKILSAGLSKLSFTCPGDHFKGWLILWKNVIVFYALRFWAKKVTKVVESVFIVSSGKFRRIFPKVLRFLFFRTLSKVFGVSPNISLQDCQNCFLCVQRTFMGQKVFLIENLYQFLSFSDFERNQFDFSWKQSDTIVEIAFHMSQETFRGVFFRKICACSFFCIFFKNCLNFYRKTSESSLKLHSLCPEQQLEENVFSNILFLVFLVFGLWSKILWKVSQWVQ